MIKTIELLTIAEIKNAVAEYTSEDGDAIKITDEVAEEIQNSMAEHLQNEMMEYINTLIVDDSINDDGELE